MYSTNYKKVCVLIFCLAVTISISLAQEEQLEISGAIQISNSQDPTPDPGTIRWTGDDFEGRTSTGWKSLTTNSITASNTVSDIDGNVYLTVTIGTQTWMRENLRTSRYNDGSIIPEKTLDVEWINESPAWCWYDNDPKYDLPYGKLYNWYAVHIVTNGGKNVCPTGWHVPSDPEFTVLVNFLGGELVAGAKAKEVGTAHWDSSNTNATNESGFLGRGAGVRWDDGDFLAFRDFVQFWTATESTAVNAWHHFLEDGTEKLLRAAEGKKAGRSVRCVKD